MPWHAVGTRTRAFARFWLYDGTSAILLKDIPIGPWTPRVEEPAVPQLTGTFTPDKPIPLPSTSHSLRMSVYVAEELKAVAWGRTF